MSRGCFLIWLTQSAQGPRVDVVGRRQWLSVRFVVVTCRYACSVRVAISGRRWSRTVERPVSAGRLCCEPCAFWSARCGGWEGGRSRRTFISQSRSQRRGHRRRRVGMCPALRRVAGASGVSPGIGPATVLTLVAAARHSRDLMRRFCLSPFAPRVMRRVVRTGDGASTREASGRSSLWGRKDSGT